MDNDLYWISTAQPFVRFPVFLMGVLGGLQVIRSHQNRTEFEDPNLNRNLLHTILPWGCCNFKARTTNDDLPKAAATKIWKNRTDFFACFYFGSMLLGIVSKIFFVSLLPNPDTFLADYEKERLIWGAYLQFFSVPIQLTIVIGLCMDDGVSRTSVFFKTNAMQVLGRVSFSLYLLHIPTKSIFQSFLKYYDIVWPSGTPMLIVILSIVFSFIATKYLEEPLVRTLRCKQSK